jgi:hypothetical protein
MARSRKPKAAVDAGVVTTVAAPADTVSCLAVGEAILIDGTRTVPGRWYTVPTAAAAAWNARGIFYTQAQLDTLWDSPGRVLSPLPTASTYTAAPHVSGALRVLQLTHYDPGCAAYRYHSAANTVSGIVSAFARIGHSNPACELRQWDVDTQLGMVQLLLRTADVVHCHMDYTVLLNELGGLPNGVRAAITYHGSTEPQRPVITYPDADIRMGSVVFGARPYHRRFNAQWLPIPMPVDDYAALSSTHQRGDTLRVCHSPTRREIKGTDVLLQVVEELRTDGLAIELVLVEGMSHGDALQLKATCDVTFDSFWLGMQGSGLEAAAMGQVVIAGTRDADYARVGLEVPWTIANDADGLRRALRACATDADFYARERARVGAYVRAHHSYTAVGTLYRTLLTEAVRGTANAA